MDPRDLERIRGLLPHHPELSRLWEEHRRLEDEIGRLEGFRVLGPEETARRTELKKRKLAGRDRIQRILDRAS